MDSVLIVLSENHVASSASSRLTTEAWPGASVNGYSTPWRDLSSPHLATRPSKTSIKRNNHHINLYSLTHRVITLILQILEILIIWVCTHKTDKKPVSVFRAPVPIHCITLQIAISTTI